MIPPHDATLSEKFSFWLSVLQSVECRGDYHVACCPAHGDDKPSLVTQIGDKGIVATCHAGCSFPSICSAAGIPPSWMFDRPLGKPSKPMMRETGSWIYLDELGDPVFRTVRLEDGTVKANGKANKEFRQQSPDGKGGWKNGVKGVRVIPYRLPDITFSTGVVLIVEGEKHCDRLAEIGFTATCNAGGADASAEKPKKSKGKWKAEHSKFLRGRDVVILPDNDEPGRRHAKNVAKSLEEHGVASVKVCVLPGLKETGDVIDWLDAGGTAEQLRDLINSAVTVEEALSEPTESDDQQFLPPITNHTVSWRGEDQVILPVSIQTIIDGIQERTDGFPKRVGAALFVRASSDSVSWLQTTPALFGWLGSVTGFPANFRKAANLHSPPEIFAELQRSAEAFDSVEVLPHIPPLPRHYYIGGTPEPGDGAILEQLIDFYSPESEIDRDLVIAAFVTPFWGGGGGKRPIFVITSDAGRGSGKSTLAGHISQLAGGHIELSSNEDINQVKQRLLSPEGVTKRVALLDNIKSLRFSSAEYEALVTAPTISGKRLYVGEAQRPGTLTHIITVNGPAFGRDIAQRSVVIKLSAPRRTATWSQDVTRFIEKNRQALIADVVAFLNRDRIPLSRHTRWSDWESDVLGRLPEPDDAQMVIVDRQALTDAEDDEIGLVQEGFSDRLHGLGYSPTDDRIHIPSGIAAEWYCEITRDRHSTTSVSRRLKQGIDEGTITQLIVNKTCVWGRGFVWVGPATQGTLHIKTGSVKTDLPVRIQEKRDGKF